MARLVRASVFDYGNWATRLKEARAIVTEEQRYGVRKSPTFNPKIKLRKGIPRPQFNQPRAE